MTLSRPPARDRRAVTALLYDGLATFEFGIVTEIFALERPEIDRPMDRPAAVHGVLRRLAGMGSSTSTRTTTAAEQLTPLREQLDTAGALLTDPAGLQEGAVLLDLDDYYLAAALVLEQVSSGLGSTGDAEDG